MDILKLAQNVEEDVIKWRRYFHENPEVGFDLPKTVKYITERLDEMGIPYETEVGAPSSVVAFIQGGEEGPTLALRGDTDALPMGEETDFDFKSKNENMHACGHDAHAAILLGAAKVLQENKDQLKGNVKLIFQPAEELGTGAKKMVEAGVMEDVDRIIGLHVGNIAENIPHGSIVFSHGPMMSCMDKFKITVKGVAAHGSTPERSIDPVVIGAEIVTGLQIIRSREIDSRDPGVISVGSLHAGSAFNIIPETCELEGTVRALTNETREFMAKRIGEIAENIAKAYRAEIDYEFFFQPPPLVNDEEVSKDLMESSRKLFPEDIIHLEKPVMGGEDFADFLQEKPGAYIFLETPKEVDGRVWPHHNSKFALDESQFKKGVAIFVQYALDYLS